MTVLCHINILKSRESVGHTSVGLTTFTFLLHYVSAGAGTDVHTCALCKCYISSEQSLRLDMRTPPCYSHAHLLVTALPFSITFSAIDNTSFYYLLLSTLCWLNVPFTVVNNNGTPSTSPTYLSFSSCIS